MEPERCNSACVLRQQPNDAVQRRLAIAHADATVEAVLQKARFWQRFAAESLNERQIKMLDRLLDGFEGRLTRSRWARITKISQDTALRDIKDLIERGALRQEKGGGRSTSYGLVHGGGVPPSR